MGMNIIDQMGLLSDQIKDLQEQLKKLKDKSELTPGKHSGEHYTLTISESRSPVLDPGVLFDELPAEHFFECMTPKVSCIRKYVAPIRLDEIATGQKTTTRFIFKLRV